MCFPVGSYISGATSLPSPLNFQSTQWKLNMKLGHEGCKGQEALPSNEKEQPTKMCGAVDTLKGRDAI